MASDAAAAAFAAVLAAAAVVARQLSVSSLSTAPSFPSETARRAALRNSCLGRRRFGAGNRLRPG